MRRALLSSVVLVTLVMLAGCTINHDFNLPIDISFTVASPTLTSYTLSQVVDPTSNSDFNNNKDKISNINITSAEYTITRCVPVSGQTVSASLQAADANGANMGVLIAPTTVSIVPNGMGPLTVNNTVANQLCNWFKNSPNKATVTLQATTNMIPTNFDVKITLHGTATYSASIFSFL